MANILVYIETIEDQADPASLDALAAMREVASKLGATLYAVMPTVEPPVYGEDDIVAVISRRGADKVILLSHPSLSAPACFENHGPAMLAAAQRLPPSMLVFADTPTSRDVAAGCAAQLAAPLLVHPTIDLEREPWLAVAASRLHDETMSIALAEAERPVVTIMAPGHRPLAADTSDDAEVVVLSPKAPNRRLAATAIGKPVVPARGADLLVVADRDSFSSDDPAIVLRLAERLHANLRMGPVSDLPEKGAETQERVDLGPGRPAPGARAAVLLSDQPTARLVTSLPVPSALLWIGTGKDSAYRHAEARLTGSASDLLAELVDLLPKQERTTSKEAFSEAPSDPPPAEKRTERASSVDTLVLLAGPAPSPKGPGIEDICDLLEPARRAALSIPARRRVVLCCGDSNAEALLDWFAPDAFDLLVRIEPPVSGPMATKGLSRLLAAAIRKLGADLVVTGHRGAMWHRGVTGPATALALGWPFLTGALPPVVVGAEGVSVRQMAWQTQWTWSVELPALISVAQSLTLPGGRGTRNNEPEPSRIVWNLADVAVQKEDILPLCRPAVTYQTRARKPAQLESPRQALDWIQDQRSSPEKK